MNTFFIEVTRTLSPRSDPKHGPLPPLLVAMTLVTGLVDAFSYLALGHVFVANMTGNVVFLAFAIAGAQGFSIAASFLALAAFWVGAAIGGSLGTHAGPHPHRGHILAKAVTVEAVLFAVCAVLVLVHGHASDASYRYPIIALLSIGMGVQNATVRRLGVPGLTTTVLTLTITGAAADSVLAGGQGVAAGRGAVSVGTMFLGALAGALLVIHAHPGLPLVAALVAVSAVGAVAWLAGRSNPNWASTE